MTIEAEIIEALRASHVTQGAILEEVSRNRALNDGLKLKISDLEATVAKLEAAKVNLVEPKAVKPVIAELGRVLAEGYGVIVSMQDGDAPETGEPRRERASARRWS